MDYFKVGSIVKIKRHGKLYPTYIKMAKIMNLEKFEYGKFQRNATILREERGKIISKQFHHLNHSVMVYGIRLFNYDIDIIVGHNGVELIAPPLFSLKNELFEI